MVRQYIGARYVPKFSDVNDGVWSDIYSYEPLTIVLNGNDFYTSKRPVPVGIPITNTYYWVRTGNYSGAISSLQEQVTENKNDIESLETIVGPLENSNPVKFEGSDSIDPYDVLSKIVDYSDTDITFIKSNDFIKNTEVAATTDNIRIGQFNIASISEHSLGAYGIYLSALATNILASLGVKAAGLNEVYSSSYISLSDVFSNEVLPFIIFGQLAADNKNMYKYGDALIAGSVMSGLTSDTITVNGKKLHYLRTVLQIGNRNIAIYSAHMDFSETSSDYINALSQFYAVVNADNEAYRIVCMDTNIFLPAVRSQAYAPFANAGYHFANNGLFNTFPTSEPPSDGAIDEIIVSSNITIKNAYMYPLASNSASEIFDHNILYADISLI